MAEGVPASPRALWGLRGVSTGDPCLPVLEPSLVIQEHSTTFAWKLLTFCQRTAIVAGLTFYILPRASMDHGQLNQNVHVRGHGWSGLWDLQPSLLYLSPIGFMLLSFLLISSFQKSSGEAFMIKNVPISYIEVLF